MRVTEKQVMSAGDLSGNLESDPIGIKFALGFSLQAVYTGAPVGTLTLQCSNNGVTWDDSTVKAVSAAGHTLFNVDGAFYKMARLKWVASSGTGALDIFGLVKGI